MSHPKKLLSHFSPVLPVNNVGESIKWYVEKLGFQVNFQWQDPPTYAVLERDDLKVHLTQKEDQYVPSSVHTHLYFFVHDVDQLYQELKDKDLNLSAPEEFEYGMREFDLIEPNGFRFTFGKGQ